MARNESGGRIRKRKPSEKPSGNYDMRLKGPIRVIELSRDQTWPDLGEIKRATFYKTSVKGNFVDPNPHTWRKTLLMRPSGHVCLDFNDAYNYAHWYHYHSYYNNCYYDMDTVAPYVNSDESEYCFGGSLKKTCEFIAMKKFYSSLRESESQFAVDVAEAKKSYDMIHERLKQIVNLARSVRRKCFAISRRNPNDPTKTPQMIMAKTWLEYKYGWSPLVSSVFGLADATRNLSKNGKFRIKRTHRMGSDRVIPRTNSLNFRGITLQKLSTFATVSADFEVNCAWLNSASRFIGLNPLSIVWELVPYSFVADWFIDIGGYLQDYETSLGLGLTFKRGYQTYVHDVDNKVYIPAQKATNGSRIHMNYDNVIFKQEFRDKARTALYSLPRPGLPAWDPKLGASRIVSGAALLLNLLTKFNPRDRFHDRVKFDPWGPGWKYF